MQFRHARHGIRQRQSGRIKHFTRSLGLLSIAHTDAEYRCLTQSDTAWRKNREFRRDIVNGSASSSLCPESQPAPQTQLKQSKFGKARTCSIRSIPPRPMSDMHTEMAESNWQDVEPERILQLFNGRMI
jgi:hypothetical protein